jgi:hypothetical protein
MKTTTRRLGAGVYEVTVGQTIFRVEEVRRSEGFAGHAQWNISERGQRIAFDAANTLREAREMCEIIAANMIAHPEWYGKPLIDVID